MKKFCFLLLLIIITFSTNFANYVTFKPYQAKQPDGTIISCYMSGDEFFNWLHDLDGYSIIRGDDGFMYYAQNDGNKIVPSKYRVNTVAPSKVGLEKWVKISKEEYLKRRESFQSKMKNSSKGPHTGTFNNIVIYISFQDATVMDSTRAKYDVKMNNETGISLKSYYNEVSYNQLAINSTHYPECANPQTTNATYIDPNPRGYYRVYNATTNPIGYRDYERTDREMTLLKNAINWVNTNSPVPSSINIDGDDDGYIDNICFMVQGNCDEWADLLWAHRWVYFYDDVYINGKQFNDFTFQPENQAEVQTICHEMFHALGAPDLYHYTSNGIAPASVWDLMENGFGHMTAYMKWKYTSGSWISEIPEISTAGVYTLNPLSSPTNNCYKIASPYSTSEFYVVEYRKAEGTFESNLPGSGLIVYRINPYYEGNASGPPDELYVYRPGGTLSSNGNPYNAFFSSNVNRTIINDITNPSGFLQNGTPGGLSIHSITSAGSTISFTLDYEDPVIENPKSFNPIPVVNNRNKMLYTKNIYNNSIIIAYNTTPVFGTPVNGVVYNNGNTIPGGGTILYKGNYTNIYHSNLTPATKYYYKIWSQTGTNIYSEGKMDSATTLSNTINSGVYENFNSNNIPTNWNFQNIGEDIQNQWSISTSNHAGGLLNEIVCNSQNISQGTTRLLLPPINTVGYSKIPLSFKSNILSLSKNVSFKIQTSDDGIYWDDESWTNISPTNSGATIVNTNITKNLNLQTTLVAFVVDGDLSSFSKWYIDDIQLDFTTNTEIVTNKELSIYPNPSSGMVNLQVTADQSLINVSIYSLDGKKVFENVNLPSTCSLNISNLNEGIYFIQIKQKGKTYRQKIMIKK